MPETEQLAVMSLPDPTKCPTTDIVSKSGEAQQITQDPDDDARTRVTVPYSGMTTTCRREVIG
jgi:hypothetical protein